MKKLLILVTAFLLDHCSSNPFAGRKDSNDVDDIFKIYSGNHDIINIVFPINAINFGDDNNQINYDKFYSLFFTEVDIKDNGEKDYKGLYVLNNDTAYKLLKNGRDSAACNDRKKNVYFAASDGIYLYNAENKTAGKYGTLNDNFINIVQENGTDKTVLYAINNKYEIFKITEEGTKKKRVAGVTNAQQLVIDFNNNIYFYDLNKEVYVINKKGVTKVEGLKKNPEYIQLINPAIDYKDFATLLLDDNSYMVYANGSSKLSEKPSDSRTVKFKPTGFAMEADLLMFYAYNKTIYKFNIVEVILSDLFGPRPSNKGDPERY